MFIFRRFRAVSLQKFGVRCASTEISNDVKPVAVEKLKTLLKLYQKTKEVSTLSDNVAQLSDLIRSIQSAKDMKLLKNLYVRKLGLDYRSFLRRLLKNNEQNPEIGMKMVKQHGVEQVEFFHRTLEKVIEESGLDKDTKRDKLYEIITLQQGLFPKVALRQPLNLPENVQEWFHKNIAREALFNHYFFCIQKNIYLSTSKYQTMHMRRLLGGSKLECNLATFDVFFQDEDLRQEYYKKYCKVYSLKSIILIIKQKAKDKDFRHMKLHFAALQTRLLRQKHSISNPKNVLGPRYDLLKFNYCLLYFLSETKDYKMFMEVMKVTNSVFKSLSIDLSSEPNKYSFPIIMNQFQKPIVSIFQLQLKNKKYDEFFKTLHTIQRMNLPWTTTFKQHIIGQLITASRRTFNDPKQIIQYLLLFFPTTKTAKLLNDLGVWSCVFHQHSTPIPLKQLNEEIKPNKLPVSKNLSIAVLLPNSVILTEMYASVLDHSLRSVESNTGEHLIRELFKRYKNVTFERSKIGRYFRQNTSILNVFLYRIRFVLKNEKMAYEILLDFFNSPCIKYLKYDKSSSPFSLLIHRNSTLTQAQINNLLVLMDKHKFPLDFKFCAAMVLRYMKLGDTERAHSWYQRILSARFELKYRPLIKIALDNNWQMPKDLDSKLLETLDSTKDTALDDENFLNEEEVQDNGAELSKAIEELTSLYQDILPQKKILIDKTSTALLHN